jgi:RNA polymerase sigma-70 factor (ECF subfamily)
MDAPSEAEFQRLTAPYRQELLLHCYRMLGSQQDAEDTLQETLVKAWRGLPSFEGRSSVRRWLYRIATHASLDVLARRKARRLPEAEGPPAHPATPLPEPRLDDSWLGPLPEEALPEDPSARNPEATLSVRESVQLAFLAAIHGLPPRQRAVLLLRDVVGYSAEETAELLGLSVAAANSALQRARPIASQALHPRGTELREAELLARYMAAFEAADVDGLVALLREEVTFSMPPMPLWLSGRPAVLAFHADTLFPRMPPGSCRMVELRVNDCPALAVWMLREDRYEPIAISVLQVQQDAVRSIHTFLALDPSLSFDRFGLSCAPCSPPGPSSAPPRPTRSAPRRPSRP